MQNKSEMFGVVARSIQWSQAVCRKGTYMYLVKYMRIKRGHSDFK